jgi:hypothetical protein
MGAAVAPHLFIPAFTGEVVRFPDQRLALAAVFSRPLGENVRHGPRLRKLFLEEFAVAAGDGRWMVLRSHGERVRTRRAASRNRRRYRGEVTLVPMPVAVSAQSSRAVAEIIR